MFNFRHLKNLQFLNQTFPRAGRSVHVRSLCVLMCVNKFTEESPWEQTNNNLKTKKKNNLNENYSILFCGSGSCGMLEPGHGL